MASLCECGCGGDVKAGNRFVHGHNARTEHPMQGRKHSEATRARLRETHQGPRPWMVGIKASAETCRKNGDSHRGTHCSNETKQKMSDAQKRRWSGISDEDRKAFAEKISASEKGKVVSAETRINISNAHKGKRCSPGTEFKKGIVPWQRGRSPSDESIIKNRESNKKRITPEMRKQTSVRMKTLWENPEHAKKCLCINSPNKQEMKLMGILDSMYPGEWKFVGDGQVIIAGKCPDFINVNGQKKIIELYGEPWHRDDDPQDRINVFKPFGYETLVIWGRELRRKDELKGNLRNFCEG